MRHDNKGMSLVELILALTMATIVMGAVTLFLRTALNTYSLADAHIDVQKEAQINIEQIGTWIMQGNRIGAGEVTMVSSDSAVTPNEGEPTPTPAPTVTYNTVDKSILVVFDEPYSDSSGTYSQALKAKYGSGGYGFEYTDDDTDVKVFWLGENGKLYMLNLYSKTSYDTSGNIISITIEGAGTGDFARSNFSTDKDALEFLSLPGSYTRDRLKHYEDDEHVMAEYAVDFSASLVNSLDASNNVTGSIINLSLTLEEERVRYTVTDQYAIRNVLR